MNQKDVNPMRKMSSVHWDALKEALQSGLVTGEVIVKGLGKMTLQSLVARMER